MNVDDSERMLSAFPKMQLTDEVAEADVILFNTCTVREKAKHKVLSALGELKELKKQRPDIIIGIAGCVAQEEGENLRVKHWCRNSLRRGLAHAGHHPALLQRRAIR